MREDYLLFEKILESFHPLCAEIVRGLVHPQPGIYFIRNGNIVKYVGRSTTNLQKRLLHHSNQRENHLCLFSFHHVKTAVDAYRLESSAIFYFNRIEKLDNRINAALPRQLRE
jgi:hypothetical protein